MPFPRTGEAMIPTAFATLLLAFPADYVADLTSKSAERREAAVAALKERPDEAKTVSLTLAQLAAGTDPSAAFVALTELGPLAKDALPALKELAKSRTNNGALAGALLAITASADKDVVRYALSVRSLKAESPYVNQFVIDRYPALAGPLADLLTTDPDETIRADAAVALGHFTSVGRRGGPTPLEQAGEAGKKVAPALEGALKDKSATVRREAVVALMAIRPEALKQALPEIVSLIRTGHLTSYQAAQPLAPSVAKAVPMLLEAIRTADDDTRERIAGVLSEFREPGIPLLLPALKDADPKVRNGVVSALGCVWGQGETLAPHLVAALADSDADVRLTAAERLAAGRTSQTAAGVPVLIDSLKRDAARARVRAAFGLLAIGKAAKPAIPTLTEALKDSSSDAALMAGRALVAIDPAAAAPAVPVLVKYGLDDTSDVRRTVAEELGRLGPMADAALPRLTALLKDHYPSVRAAAAVALMRIDPMTAPAATEALTGLLHTDPTKLVGNDRLALRALREIGPAAKTAIPALEMRLAVLQADRQLQVAGTVLALDPDHAVSLRLFRELLASGDFEAFEDAARNLDGLGAAAVRLVPNLIPFVMHKEDYARGEAADLLGRVGPRAAAALPALRAQLTRERNKHVMERIERAITAITGAL